MTIHKCGEQSRALAPRSAGPYPLRPRVFSRKLAKGQTMALPRFAACKSSRNGGKHTIERFALDMRAPAFRRCDPAHRCSTLC
jgi:hypothetical protein